MPGYNKDELAHNGLVDVATHTVSVIIPCYGQAHFLPQAIESVLAQTHPAEIVVVDDGSPDNTGEVARRYPRVRYFRQENQGLSGARNAGFLASSGEYVMFLDADDRLTPTAVEMHLRCFAQHPAAGFVVGDIDQITAEGAFKDSPRWPLLETNHYEELLKVNHVANTIAVMFRRSVLEKVGEFDTSLPACEDYEMLLRAARLFASAHHRTVVAHYRRYQASMTRNGVLMLREMRRVMRSQCPFVKGNSRLEAARRKGDNYWREHYGVVSVRQLYGCLRRGDLLRASQVMLALLWYVRGRLVLFPWILCRRAIAALRRRYGRATETHGLLAQ